MNTESVKIAVIGLGYVGLPLAVEFSKKYSVIGFDINKPRVKELFWFGRLVEKYKRRLAAGW